MLRDFVFRRTGLGTLGHPGDEALRVCSELIGRELGWSTQRRQEEVADTSARFSALNSWKKAA